MKWITSIEQFQQALLNVSGAETLTPNYALTGMQGPTQKTTPFVSQHWLRFFMFRPGPVTSPDGYIWDPQRRRWIPNRSGDGLLGLILGALFTLIALKLLGVLE